MKSASRLAFVFLFFTVTTFHLAAQGRNPFFAGYQGKSFDGEHKMNWSFGRKNDGSITVNILIPNPDAAKIKGKKPPPNFGQAEGFNVKLQGDVLEFELKWSERHKIKGPMNAKYVATVKGNDLTVKWTAGDEKGEITAVNTTNPVVIAKKDDKKDEKKPVVAEEKKKDEKPKKAGERVYLSGLTDDRGIPIEKGTITQLSIVIVGAKSSKAQVYKVTKDTKFVVVDGDDSKTFDQKTVLSDSAVRLAFRERYVILERQGPIALTVTATAPKKKDAK